MSYGLLLESSSVNSTCMQRYKASDFKPKKVRGYNCEELEVMVAQGKKKFRKSESFQYQETGGLAV